MFNKYYFVIYFTVVSFILSDEQHIISYTLEEGPNLISFPISSNNNSIDLFFTSENTNFHSNYSIDQSIVSIISEGELTFNNGLNWVGSLDQINTDQGYWMVIDQNVTFLLEGENINDNVYFLHPGANLISYPFSIEQSSINALNLFSTDMIYAILGENSALLSINDTWYGSLDTFEPGKGYWFIVSDYSPFVYNQPDLNNSSNNHLHDTEDYDDFEPSYNQSTLQSVFFIESIYHSGEEVSNNILLNLYCNDIITGQNIWNSNFTDIIAMGDDGFDNTSNYCMQNQKISINSSENANNYYFLKGGDNWLSNNFNINILSNVEFGDLNYNNVLNITDVVIMLEHILEVNYFQNSHKILLADVNQDSNINIADIIANIENILNN